MHSGHLRVNTGMSCTCLTVCLLASMSGVRMLRLKVYSRMCVYVGAW